jgi:hypothetical protein
VNRKIPPDAFEQYFSLGPERSYEALAKSCGVSKRAVSKLATKERWQERLRELERKARERSDEKVLETLEDMSARHLKVLRFIQNKAIEALKSMPLDSAMEAVRAYHVSVEKERLIRGEPSDRTEMSLEEITKREMRTLLVRVRDDPEERREVADDGDAA